MKKQTRKILLFSNDYRCCQRFNRSHKELSTPKYAIRMRIARKILHNTIDNVINVYKCLKIYETEREKEYEKEKITNIKGSRMVCLNSVNNKASGIILQELLIQ